MDPKKVSRYVPNTTYDRSNIANIDFHKGYFNNNVHNLVFNILNHTYI